MHEGPIVPYLTLEDTLRPTSQDELRARAAVLTMGVGELSSKQLREYIDHCDEPPQNQPAEQVTQRRLADVLSLNLFQPVLKELLCLNLWLIFIEVANKESELPEWFHELLILCHAVADKIYTMPAAQEIKQKYSLNGAPSELCMMASFNICMQLDLGSTRDDAMLYLGSLLERDLEKRGELLGSALTEQYQSIQKRIKVD